MATGKIVRSVSISIQQTVSKVNITEKNAYRQKEYFLDKKYFYLYTPFQRFNHLHTTTNYETYYEKYRVNHRLFFCCINYKRTDNRKTKFQNHVL